MVDKRLLEPGRKLAMTDSAEDQDIQFVQLIISLHAGTMQQMGKVANLATGKIERNMLAAKNSIDLLGMLQRKMKGNLNDGESKMLESTLFELRMNYVDEVKKDAEESGKSAKSDNSVATDDSDGLDDSDGSNASEEASSSDTKKSSKSDKPDDSDTPNGSKAPNDSDTPTVSGE